MMWDEKQLRDALREEINGPAPAVRTELSDIMPRGLRRRRYRQAGSIAAAVAVVAGVGVVAMTFGGNSSSLNEPAHNETTSTITTTTPEAPWSRAPFGVRAPYGTYSPAATAPLPPEWPRLEIPQCGADDVGNRMNRHGSDVTEQFKTRLMTKLREVAAPATVGELKRTNDFTNVIEYTVDISDGAGTGSLQVLAKQVMRGDVVQEADGTAFAESNCQPPKRRFGADGSLMQLYSVTASEPFQSLRQRLIIFWPTGVQYTLTVRNWSSKDVRRNGNSYDRFGMGRPTLPLTEYQLAKLAESLVGE